MIPGCGPFFFARSNRRNGAAARANIRFAPPPPHKYSNQPHTQQRDRRRLGHREGGGDYNLPWNWSIRAKRVGGPAAIWTDSDRIDTKGKLSVVVSTGRHLPLHGSVGWNEIEKPPGSCYAFMLRKTGNSAGAFPWTLGPSFPGFSTAIGKDGSDAQVVVRQASVSPRKTNEPDGSSR